MARRPVDPRRPSVARRIAKAIIGLVVAAAMLGGAIVLVDLGLRDFAETRAESEIKRRVPGSAVTADVTINGFSVLWQVVRGELDDVDVAFTITSEGLDRLAQNAGHQGGVQIAEGAVTINGTIEVLGAAIPYAVHLEPALDEAGYLVLTAAAASVIDESLTFDLTQFLDLGTAGFKVCTAELLPASFELTGFELQDDVVEVTAHGSGVPTNMDALSTRGECTPAEVEGAGETPSE